MEAYYQAPSLGGGTGVFAMLTGGKARTDPQVAKRETIKSGSKDEGTTWARARCQFAQQLKRQFRKGARIVAAEDCDDPAQAALELPIFRGGVVFGDEHHRQTKLGHATKYEVRIRRDASGKVAPPEKGGVLNAKNMKVTQKFNKEARGLFMVA